MLYFYHDKQNNLIATSTYPADTSYFTRHDFGSLAEAQAVADELGDNYIATDAGRGCSPQFDVEVRPQIGDDVSYAFNGDYYPCGQIVKISPTMKKITTSNGDTFYRLRQTGSWKMNGTWSLVSGHHNKRNPSF